MTEKNRRAKIYVEAWLKEVTAISIEETKPTIAGFTGYEKFVVAVLAFLQFTIILDFLIMAPLGAIMMPALDISTANFGLVVSVYAFSAGAAGLFAAGFADRYDRKTLLLFFYAGFIIGTLLCGVATSYEFLLFARIVTGLFGGVIGSISFAITTDLFPMEKRGRVMGLMQTAFAASQVLGLPIGLYLSNKWNWHAPFLMIVALSTVVGILIFVYLRPINSHLMTKSERSPLRHLLMTLGNGRYAFAFCATALLSIGGFMLMPFGSAFTVHNLQISVEKLPLIYGITGLCSIAIGPLVGRASDSFGNFPVFIFGSILTIIMVVYYTNMGPSSLVLTIVVNAVMFVGIFSRMIPSQALMSGIPDSTSRGAFMSVCSSLQQIAGGLASIVAGAIVVQTSDGVLRHFDTLGYIMVGTTLVSLTLMFYIDRASSRRPQL